MDLQRKIFLTTIFITTLFGRAQAAEVFYVPAFCAPTSLQLTVANPSHEAQRFWTQTHLPDDSDNPAEVAFELAPHQTRAIQGSEFLNTSSGFAVKTRTPGVLHLQVQCGRDLAIPLTTTISPVVSHYFPPATKNIKLQVLSLSLAAGPIVLSAYDEDGKVLETKTFALLKYYDTQALKWNLQKSIARVEVRGVGRLHSWAFFDNGVSDRFSPALVVAPVTLNPDLAKVYFLVAAPGSEQAESYVVGFDDPSQIATARAQIDSTGFPKILVGRITLGDGGFNRAFFTRDRAPYSWHVSRIDAFADFAHISCDGSPDLTEERLMPSLNNGGRICFWKYRIVRELKAHEVRSGILGPQP